jgi:hypothetical protein
MVNHARQSSSETAPYISVDYSFHLMAVPLRVAVPVRYHLPHCLSYVMLVHIHTGQKLELKVTLISYVDVKM